MSTPAGWFPEPSSGGDAALDPGHDVQPLWLVLALVPLLGILLGVWAMVRGRHLTGSTTVGIIVSLLYESLLFFRAVPVWDFLFGTRWCRCSASCSVCGRWSAAAT